MSRLARIAVVGLCLAAAPAVSGPAQQVLSFLQPGSRPALGLGGDPFRSALADEIGWWATLDPPAGSTVTLEHLQDAPVTARLSRHGGVLAGQRSRASATWRTSAGMRSIVLLARIESSRAEAASRSQDTEFVLTGADAVLTTAARIDDVLPGVTVQGAIPAWRDGGAAKTGGTHAGLRYRRGRWFAAQVAWDRAASPLEVTGALDGERVLAAVNARREVLTWDGLVQPWRSLAMDARWQRAWTDPARGITTAPDYELEPSGSSESWHATVAWRDDARFGALVRLTRTDHALVGDAYWGGQRFGELSSLRHDVSSRLVACEWRPRPGARWLAEVEWAAAAAAGRGEVESWPFTSGIVDLLGARRVFKGAAELDWTRWHLGHARACGRGQFEAGATWYALTPRAELVSWQPLLLVFGRTDVRTDRLDVTRAHLMALSVGYGFPLGGLRCDLAVQQFVFARLERGAAEPAAAGEPATAGSATAASPGGWIGGTYARAAVTYGW